MKESDSVQTRLNEYESLSSQISAQRTTIEDELRAMMLMSSLPPSWETFVTTVCYSEVTSAIRIKAARRKSFAKDSADEAYIVQGSADRQTTEEEVPPDCRQISEAGASSSVVPFGVGSLRESARDRRGYGLGGGEY